MISPLPPSDATAESLPEELIGPRVQLRRYQASDAPDVWEAVVESRATLKRWAPQPASRGSLEEVRAGLVRLESNWDNTVRLVYAVRNRHSGDYLGELGFYEIDRGRRIAEVGYWLRDGAVGHGYMSEALAILCRSAFSRLVLARIEALVQPGNERSLKTTESAGFHLAGFVPRRPERDGQDSDEMCVYVLDDPESVGPPPNLEVC